MTDDKQTADILIKAVTGFTSAQTEKDAVILNFLDSLSGKKHSKNTDYIKLFKKYKETTNYPQKTIDDLDTDVTTQIRFSIIGANYLIEKGLEKDFEAYENRIINEILLLQEKLKAKLGLNK